jgi:predicted kinase
MSETLPIRLIILTGLPGAGKSRLAEALGHALGIPVFAKDFLEATLLRAGLAQLDGAGDILGRLGYDLLTELAQRQHHLGQSAILDSVASTAAIRDEWRSLAASYGATWRVIECVCSDETVHRVRLAQRQRKIPGWPELEWSEVERVRGHYAPWEEDRLMLDAVDPFERNLHAALNYVRSPDCGAQES